MQPPKQTKCKLRFTTDYVKLLNHFPFDGNFHRHWRCSRPHLPIQPQKQRASDSWTKNYVERNREREGEKAREWDFGTIVLMECFMVYYSLGPEKEQQQKHTGNNNKTVITHNHHTTLSGCCLLILFCFLRVWNTWSLRKYSYVPDDECKWLMYSTL